ncbi:hypothetical protein [Cerasicoccus maritimus]|uniref:hypothetical protein n=1 Tax=Cerasicoccus maritimus TaxID=490089 RepID=UPI002852550D|nr:hypothetical protein [Cerasicoccus maritimus]
MTSYNSFEEDLDSLADQYERRGLRLAIAISLASSPLPFAMAAIMGINFTGRSLSFWFIAIAVEAIFIFIAWFITTLIIVPPRDHLDKMNSALQFALTNTRSVSMDHLGREVSINMPDERITLTGAEAAVFRKHWQRR